MREIVCDCCGYRAPHPEGMEGDQVEAHFRSQGWWVSSCGLSDCPQCCKQGEALWQEHLKRQSKKEGAT